MVLSNISNYKSEEWVILYESEVYADDQFAVGIKCYVSVTHWAAQASDWALLVCEHTAISSMGWIFLNFPQHL